VDKSHGTDHEVRGWNRDALAKQSTSQLSKSLGTRMVEIQDAYVFQQIPDLLK
jgi:hypothetical protein